MTREEAIDRLKEARIGHKEFLSVETLNMAIKALEQEPCKDAISRQMVHNEILALWNSNGDKDYCMESLRDFVVDLSSVTPQPKLAHWILKVEDWNKWTCSNCGYSKRTDVHVTLGYNYCPKCGARMVESKGK